MISVYIVYDCKLFSGSERDNNISHCPKKKKCISTLPRGLFEVLSIQVLTKQDRLIVYQLLCRSGVAFSMVEPNAACKLTCAASEIISHTCWMKCKHIVNTDSYFCGYIAVRSECYWRIRNWTLRYYCLSRETRFPKSSFLSLHLVNFFFFDVH